MTLSQGFCSALVLWLIFPVTASGADDALVRRTAGSSTPQDIQIIARDVLRFGSMVVQPNGAGAVVVDPAGHVTPHNGIVHLGGRVGPAVFELRGEPNARFVIDLPATIELNADHGGGTAVLREFRSVPEGFGAFDAHGRAMVHVGAALVLNDNATRGDYSTVFDLRIEYTAMTSESDKRPRGLREP